MVSPWSTQDGAVERVPVPFSMVRKRGRNESCRVCKGRTMGQDRRSPWVVNGALRYDGLDR